MPTSKSKTSGYEKILEIIASTTDMPASEAVNTLIDCVKKGHSLASQHAVYALAKINHPDIVPSLITLYEWIEESPRKRDNSCDVRITIAEVLGDAGSPVSADILRKAVRTVQVVKLGPSTEDAGIGLRATAALALAKVDPGCLFELSILLFDQKPDVPTSPLDVPYAKATARKAAAQAISVLGDLGGMPLLAVKLKFPHNEVPDVLAECIESLIFMNPPYLMEIVKPYLTGDDEYLSAIAALSLAENLRAEALDLLQEALEHASEDAKEAIVIAISATRCNKARQILFDFLDHPNHLIRRGAVKGIKAYLDDEISEKLKIIRDTDTDRSVRLEADKE